MDSIMHVSNTHLYSPNSACAWGFLLCLRVGSPLAKTCSLPICFEIQHCSSPGCLSHGVQIEKDALSTAASHEAPVHKRARQDCKQKRIFSTGASREAPVDKRAHQDCNKTRAVSTDTNRNCMKTLFGEISVLVAILASALVNRCFARSTC